MIFRKQETVKPAPSYSSLTALYKSYGYAAPDAGFEQKSLNTEWTDKDIAKLAEAVDRCIAAGNSVPQTVIINPELFLKTFLSYGTLGTLLFHEGRKVADFSFERQEINGKDLSTSWTLFHREILEEYRSQKLGSGMLKIMEKAMEYEAERTKTEQVIKIEARQLGVIKLALNNGYEPESEEDKKKLELVLSADRSKVFITTAPGGKPGYVFSVLSLQSLIAKRGLGNLSLEELQSFNLSKVFLNFDAYKKNALTIKFKKEKRPRKVV